MKKHFTFAHDSEYHLQMVTERSEIGGVMFEKNSNRVFLESITSLVNSLNNTDSHLDHLSDSTGKLGFVVFEEREKVGNTVFVFPFEKSMEHGEKLLVQVSEILNSEGVSNVGDFMSGEIGKSGLGWSVEKIFDRWGESYGEYFKGLHLFGCPVETHA